MQTTALERSESRPVSKRTSFDVPDSQNGQEGWSAARAIPPLDLAQGGVSPALCHGIVSIDIVFVNPWIHSNMSVAIHTDAPGRAGPRGSSPGLGGALRSACSSRSITWADGEDSQPAGEVCLPFCAFFSDGYAVFGPRSTGASIISPRLQL